MSSSGTTMLFVSDIAPTCGEVDIECVFQDFGDVISVKVERDPLLCYAFVEMGSLVDAFHAMEGLEGRMLFDRPLRLSWGAPVGLGSQIPQTPGVEVQTRVPMVQVLFSFISHQTAQPVTEDFIASVFNPFGLLLNVSIKRVNINQEKNSQNGYGFVHFCQTCYGVHSAVKCIQWFKKKTIDGVTLDAKFGEQFRRFLHRNQLLSKQDDQFAPRHIDPTSSGTATPRSGSAKPLSPNHYYTVSTANGSGEMGEGESFPSPGCTPRQSPRSQSKSLIPSPLHRVDTSDLGSMSHGPTPPPRTHSGSPSPRLVASGLRDQIYNGSSSRSTDTVLLEHTPHTPLRFNRADSFEQMPGGRMSTGSPVIGVDGATPPQQTQSFPASYAQAYLSRLQSLAMGGAAGSGSVNSERSSPSQMRPSTSSNHSVASGGSVGSGGSNYSGSHYQQSLGSHSHTHSLLQQQVQQQLMLNSSSGSAYNFSVPAPLTPSQHSHNNSFHSGNMNMNMNSNNSSFSFRSSNITQPMQMGPGSVASGEHSVHSASYASQHSHNQQHNQQQQQQQYQQQQRALKPIPDHMSKLQQQQAEMLEQFRMQSQAQKQFPHLFPSTGGEDSLSGSPHSPSDWRTL